MRFIYNIFIILTAFSFLISCEGFKLKKKADSGEEFLIEKKDPLILPPDFSKLPQPNEQTETVDEEVDIKSVLMKKKVVLRKITIKTLQNLI